MCALSSRPKARRLSRPGERIVVGHVAQLLDVRAALGDVLDLADHVRGLPSGSVISETRDLGPDRVAVGVDVALLAHVVLLAPRSSSASITGTSSPRSSGWVSSWKSWAQQLGLASGRRSRRARC